MNLLTRIEEMNARLFALEAKMTKYEALAIEDREYRKEVHARLLKGQEELSDRVTKLAIKIAWYAGILAMVASLPAWGPFLQKLLVKGP